MKGQIDIGRASKTILDGLADRLVETLNPAGAFALIKLFAHPVTEGGGGAATLARQLFPRRG